MKNNKMSHQQWMEREDLVSYLEDLIKSIRNGKIVIERNGEFLALTMPNMVQMELEAKTKKDKGELTIELSWRKKAETVSSPLLHISSVEPEIVPEEASIDEAAETEDDDENEVQ